MSGHSKWSQIKRKKGVADTKRGALFSKLGNRITVESRKVDGDTSAPSLRMVIEQAQSAHMPKENIERAVSRGKGVNALSLETLTYEFYGPGGAACIIEAISDNRNRTYQELRHELGARGYSILSPGGALWAFRKKDNGWEAVSQVTLSEEDGKLLSEIIEDLEGRDDVEEVYTNAE